LRELRSPWRYLVAVVPLLLLLMLVGQWSGRDAPVLDEVPLDEVPVDGMPLDELRLSGTRGPQCVRFVVASDVSGSMKEAAAARDAAVRTLLDWLPANLRDDDEVALLTFAADVGSVAGPRAVADLRDGDALTPGPATDADHTGWTPVLDAVASLPPSGCDTALLVISDARLSPLPSDADDARAQLSASGVRDLVLLVPSRELEIPGAWTELYPYAEPTRFDGTHRESTATAVAGAIADVVGQELG
jgi:hypothetical protein